MKGNGPTATAARPSGFRRERPVGHAPGVRGGCDVRPEDGPRAEARSGRCAATNRTGPPRAKTPCLGPACRPGNHAPSLAGGHRPRCTDRPAIRPSAHRPTASDQRAQSGHAGDRNPEQPKPAPAAQRSGGSEWSISHAWYPVTFSPHCRQSTTAAAHTRRFQRARADYQATRSAIAATGASVRSGNAPGFARRSAQGRRYSVRSSRLTESAPAKARRVATEPRFRPVSISATITRLTPAFSASAACVMPRRSR